MESNDFQKLDIDGTIYTTTFTKKFVNEKKWERPDERKIMAFIPGTIVKVNVKEGQKVKKGTKLLVLDAMKMKNRLVAPVSGKIKGVYVTEGQIVTKNFVLVEIE